MKGWEQYVSQWLLGASLQWQLRPTNEADKLGAVFRKLLKACTLPPNSAIAASLSGSLLMQYLNGSQEYVRTLVDLTSAFVNLPTGLAKTASALADLPATLCFSTS